VAVAVAVAVAAEVVAGVQHAVSVDLQERKRGGRIKEERYLQVRE